ncbi:O-fucosyltransferase 29 [Bienertia sinuspersici]
MGVGGINQLSGELGLVNTSTTSSSTTMNGNANVNINVNGNSSSDLKDQNLLKLQKHHFSCWRSQRKPLSWSFVCGIMLFALGLISLFTGHVVSDLEYYSQRLIKPHLYTKWSGSTHEPINIWKSKYTEVYYGCSRRGRHFRSAIPQRFSNGYLLIATSGGLNQQRTGITDAVVVARILNATLVVPHLTIIPIGKMRVTSLTFLMLTGSYPLLLRMSKL